MSLWCLMRLHRSEYLIEAPQLCLPKPAEHTPFFLTYIDAVFHWRVIDSNRVAALVVIMYLNKGVYVNCDTSLLVWHATIRLMKYITNVSLVLVIAPIHFEDIFSIFHL